MSVRQGLAPRRRARQNATMSMDPMAIAVPDIAAPDIAVTAVSPGLLEIAGLRAEQIGELAAANAIVLHELTPMQATLEAQTFSFAD